MFLVCCYRVRISTIVFPGSYLITLSFCQTKTNPAHNCCQLLSSGGHSGPGVHHADRQLRLQDNSLKTGKQAQKRNVADEIQPEQLGKGGGAKEATESNDRSAKEAKRSMLASQLQRLLTAKAEMQDTYSRNRESARLSGSAARICALLPVSAPLLSSSQPGYDNQVLHQVAATDANSTPQAEPRETAVVLTAQVCAKSEGNRLGKEPPTVGVAATSRGAPVPRRCRTTITKHEAIQIFVAKHSHTTGDHQAARLGLEFGLTNKAIRDIWTMRTWGKTTKPYWNASDGAQFSRVVTRTTTKEKPPKEHDDGGWMIPPAVIAKEFELEAMLDSWHQTSQEQFVSAASTEEFIVTLVLPFGHLG